MNDLELVIDVAMCLLWIMVYTLVLIGTVKYRYPLISPITQAIIAPLEFSVLALFIKIGAFRFDYPSIAYLYWSIIEIVIIFVMIKKQHVKKKWAILYIIIVGILTAIMFCLVTIMEKMFFFNYFNTFIGIICWLIFIIVRKDYPMNNLTLAIFIIKFIADICAFLVYFGEGNWMAKLMCICLPLVDMIFLIVYIKRKKILKLIVYNKKS